MTQARGDGYASDRMMSRPKRPYADWLLGGMMLLLCAALTVLQYRWTGEVARAEASRLRGNLDEQTRALGRAFDAELAASCDQLRPQREDFAGQTREATHLARFKEWKATDPRPIFRRIALGVASGNEIQLSLLDQVAAQLIPTNWPAEWTAMRESLLRKRAGGPPPFADERGVLLEFPVFGSRESRGEHWLILELDLEYARDHWLPELISNHINPGGRAVNEARIKLGGSNPGALYATTTDAPRADDTVVSVRFNNLGRTEHGPRGPSRDGGRWLLEAWQHRGALEATVARSRRRNFVVAAGINLLMLATGLALIHFTRRSRRLAEQQMNFVATVSHELRTPLTVIRGAGHNLLRGVVKDRGQIEEYSKLIVQHAEQLAEMVEQTLALAGADKGRAAALREGVDVAAVLREAIAAVADDIQAAQCEVQLHVPPDLPPVTGDAAALRRVFQNLITNAAKHGGEGRWIGIAAASVNGAGPSMVEIRVADRGSGIPESEQAEIFKPFARGAGARERQTRGSGLGLTVVREIVVAHGGEISVHSESGRGATFTVRLRADESNGRERMQGAQR
ncbi:MAG: HAMP domain-containing histidine kinase [Verrucomicrobiales bacterium]|nr:HAMP domain-containing histidine kinase [Verrucomicrobiales bacterium]